MIIWPHRFTNDEIWLRIRRTLFRTLREGGILADEENYSRLLHAQQQLGYATLENIAKSMGRVQYHRLTSESFLASRGYDFNNRLPFILAFGYSFSTALHSLKLSSGSLSIQVKSELSATFNLGISIFDTLSDDPNNLAELRQIFGPLINGDLNDENALTNFRHALDSQKHPDISVVGNIALNYFEGVVKSKPDAKAFLRLRQKIRSAFEAQMLSNSLNGKTEELALQTCKFKSVLPFQIMALTSFMDIPHYDQDLVSQIGDTSGHIFWYLDDLVDLLNDYYMGQCNLLILRAGGGQSDEELLTRILENNTIESVVNELGKEVAKLKQLTRGSRAFDEWLSFYACDWIK